MVMSYILYRSLANKLEGVGEATRRAVSLPILLCHGKGSHILSAYANAVDLVRPYNFLHLQRAESISIYI